ncbi:hypothetical protein JQ615_28130 [Bradyrhizobium jicamae]|uniref:Uncharacterized protein n=1 Tax=Bradyrhizobium jicamae TaxID=280332 RepID=A0ABS5FR17_9BRAD|nr:hypothetical protein [Bradyrhizobium jicamae]MBR0799265.1 hypothetical protein [Bradyrhizobium jicamae]MBR0936443.1 hypothetical protein [Bradyrhizobium jicamae]
MPFALFDRDKQIDQAFPTESEAWEHALVCGLVLDVPIADEAPGEALPTGYHMKQVSGEDLFDAAPEWKLPKQIS